MSSESLDNAETQVMPSPASDLSAPFRAAAKGMVALVEGSSPHLTTETRDLLRRRLRMAATLLFGGFVAFLGWGLLQDGFGRDPWLLGIHVCVTSLMGLMVVYLNRPAEQSLGRVRLAELLVFGDPAIYFLILSEKKLHSAHSLAEGAHLPGILVPWILLIFLYALFIPNDWRRAAAVIVPMALAPLGAILYERAVCPAFLECASRPEYRSYLAEQVIVMALVATSAVRGVAAINRLRVQAYEAKRLGQYVLRKKIGHGGMGEVYLAEHQMLKRPCAVKVIRPEKAGDPRTLARFEREVQSTAKLSHWNSIDIFDYGRTPDGALYYVMEYLPGHNVGELVEMYGPMQAERVVYLTQQVCKALTEAHGAGLVHRDIKPANIYCAYRGGEYDVAKLLDFGLAKPSFQTADTQLTIEGAITGSPLFMSPEQATGSEDIDARSDVYSLGCVMYYLLTGRYPFEHQQAVKIIIAHASEAPRRLRGHVQDLPEDLEEVVMRCLEKDPEHRFQTIAQLRTALLDLPSNSPWSSEQAAQWWSCHGCPERKAMAAALVEAAAQGDSCPLPDSSEMAATIESPSLAALTSS